MSSFLGRGKAGTAFTAMETRLLSYLLLSAVVLAVWLPGGFNVGPLNDGWLYLQHPIWISIGAGTRLLQCLPRTLGLSLTPGSFVGWQLVLLVLTLARGILVYEIASRMLDGQRAYALACGLLALFHPMDHLYFWVDASNVDMAYALALAACLAALLHLRSGSCTSLAAMCILQLASCFTYSGFVPVLGAFPVLLWLLWKLDGRPAGPAYLFTSTVAVIFFLILVILELKFGKGRESKVASFHLAGIIKGYVYQIRTLGWGWSFWVSSFRAAYLVPAAVGGAVALGAAWRAAVPGEDRLLTRRFYLLLALMLIILAMASYLPYAMSRLRAGHERQMLAGGLFLLMALLLPLFLWLSQTPIRRRIAAVAVAAIACGAVIAGLEMRRTFVDGYREQEALLASVAAALPHPSAGATIVVEPDPATLRDIRRSRLQGLRNRHAAFSEALQYMYGDDTLRGVFGDRYNRAIQFTQDGVRISGLSIAYPQLILMQRRADGSMQVVDKDSLRQWAPVGADVGAYHPETYDGSPAPGSNVCRMLQPDYRPAYCR